MSEPITKLVPLLMQIGLDEFEAVSVLNIIMELREDKMKQPDWPGDKMHGVAIINMELEKLTWAAIRFSSDDGEFQEVQMKAIHTAATALRFLSNIINGR